MRFNKLSVKSFIIPFLIPHIILVYISLVVFINKWRQDIIRFFSFLNTRQKVDLSSLSFVFSCFFSTTALTRVFQVILIWELGASVNKSLKFRGLNTDWFIVQTLALLYSTRCFSPTLITKTRFRYRVEKKWKYWSKCDAIVNDLWSSNKAPHVRSNS